MRLAIFAAVWNPELLGPASAILSHFQHSRDHCHPPEPVRADRYLAVALLPERLVHLSRDSG